MYIFSGLTMYAYAIFTEVWHIKLSI